MASRAPKLRTRGKPHALAVSEQQERHTPSNQDRLANAERHGSAAGICFYCYSQAKQDLCILMLKEARKGNKEAMWNWPGGKRKKSRRGRHRDEATQDWDANGKEPVVRTAARETEEETHWQLPAHMVEPKLADCHTIWWRDGRYTLFMVHLPDEWHLPDAINQRAATAQDRHPEASKLLGAAWIPLSAVCDMKEAGKESTFEGHALHFVPMGVLKRTSTVRWLSDELERLRSEAQASSDNAKQADSVRRQETEAGREKGAHDSQQQHSPKTVISNGDASQQGSQEEVCSRAYSAFNEHSKGWQEAVAARKMYGDVPLLWPQAEPVSSPQLNPKPQRTVIPSASSRKPQ